MKGSLSTKSMVSKASTRKAGQSSKKSKASKEKASQDLMEKLLTEITAKYKQHLCKNADYLQRLEKKTMIQEI